jgi:hypothetical protein
LTIGEFFFFGQLPVRTCEKLGTADTKVVE